MSGVSSLPVFKKKMNPEKEQDRAFDFYDHYKRFGFILFPQSKKIYENLRFEAEGRILEAGCGNGVGSYILEPRLATDILESNIKFAKEIYPRIEFASISKKLLLQIFKQFEPKMRCWARF